MSKPAPRMAGRKLQILTGVLRSRGVGAVVARAVTAQSVDAALAGLDFAAEGDPAPYYVPPPYVPSDVEASAADGHGHGHGHGVGNGVGNERGRGGESEGTR